MGTPNPNTQVSTTKKSVVVSSTKRSLTDSPQKTNVQTVKNHPAGRKPIMYSKEELERPPRVTIVVGMKEVGKTHRTKIEIADVILDKPNRKGRKALIIDFNDGDDYLEYKAVLPKYIRLLTENKPRRIIPYESNGKPFTPEKMKEIAGYIIFNYKHGLLVLEDIDKYMSGKKGQSLIGALTTNRHSGLDIIITHQSLTKISSTEWENAAFIRLHHQLDDAFLAKENINNYPLVKIAQIIVDKRYFKGSEEFKAGKISLDEWKVKRSFYVYISQLDHKIIGCTGEEFRIATMEYIRHNPRLVNLTMRIGDEDGKEYTKEEAMKQLYKQYIMFHD